MIRSLVVLSFAATCAMPLLAGSSHAAELTKAVCSGEFGTGSGMAGSTIGERCFIAADTDMQDQVSKACKENATCQVEAMVRTDADGRMQIEEVISARQLAAAQEESVSYVAKVGSYVDGILAPADQGCDEPGATPQKRISIQLGRAGGAAIQLYDRYCAITGASGGEPSDQGFNVTLQARCGRLAAKDEALRSGKAGDDDTIRLSLSADQQLRIDDETMARCAIKQAYTPRWWIQAPSFNGAYPD